MAAFSEQDIAARLNDQPSLDLDARQHERLLALNGRVRKAAVLLPLVWEADEWRLLFTRRTDHVQDHKGQVSFPGGASEEADGSPLVTALRETEEEIGIPPGKVRILGRLPEVLTNSDYLVTPVVGAVDWPQPLHPSPDEVSRVFTIPLDWLADGRHREERTFTDRKGEERLVTFFQPYDGEMLWGVSAGITVQFLEALGVG